MRSKEELSAIAVDRLHAFLKKIGVDELICTVCKNTAWTSTGDYVQLDLVDINPVSVRLNPTGASVAFSAFICKKCGHVEHFNSNVVLFGMPAGE